MTEPTNAVLAEQMRQLRKDFTEEKKSSREERKEMERDLESNRRITNELNITMAYVKDTVSEMKEMMNSFIGIGNAQNQKIDDFINSDNRASHKKNLVVSAIQVCGGILGTLATMWGLGQF